MFYFDKDEAVQLAVSMLVVAIAFSIGDFLTYRAGALVIVPAVLLGVGTGFILHELAHKFVAIRFGALARYVASEAGLAMSLIFSLVTGGQFVFAAPGAVYIYAPALTRMQNGVISLAGPLTNLVSGLALAAVSFAFAPAGGASVEPSLLGAYLAFVFSSAAHMNFMLGAFNMIPFPPLDGSKVFAWSIPAWLALAGVLAYLVFFSPF